MVDPDDGLDLEAVEVDLPKDCAAKLTNYRASLGHKARLSKVHVIVLFFREAK